jgi:chaperonin GroES
MAKNLQWLYNNIDVVNLVPSIDDATLKSIADQALFGYEIDESSRKDWVKKTEDGLKIAKQEVEKKTFPWPGAANIKYPLIATASMQFAARAYPQIVNGPDIVRAEVVGEDPQGIKQARAKRISQHMSYQCLDEMPEWEPDMDQLLHGLPVMGNYFKKTYYDKTEQRNKSICLTPFEVVVNMQHKGTLDTCRRISHRLWLYKNEVIENERSGVFADGSSDAMTNQTDDSKEQELFIEQHCWYDLDEDGYEEPYIVTIHNDSNFVCRVVANYDVESMHIADDKLLRITAIQYFTKFTFIPSPDGSFYDIGFAHLLGPINEAMSTIINQLLDAGALKNTGGGFISKGLRWTGGQLSFKLGEWKPVDATGAMLKDSIFPLPVSEPSSALFQLLGLLNETGQKLAAVSDMMSGDTPSQNTPATTVLALIEQGTKVFTAIYKRIFRSMKEEFKKLYRLNGIHLDEVSYFRVLDSQQAIFRKDYDRKDLDVIPVADPTMASEAQRMARANALLQTLSVNPDPLGKIEILRQYYDAIGAKNLDKLLDVQKLTQAATAQQPDPEVMKIQLEAQKSKDDAQIRRQQVMIDTELKLAQVQEIMTKSILNIAQAEAAEPGMQLEQYKAQLDTINQKVTHMKMMHDMAMEKTQLGAAQNGQPQQGGVSSMDGQPANTESAQSSGGSSPTVPAEFMPGADTTARLSGENGAPDVNATRQDLGSKLITGNGG